MTPPLRTLLPLTLALLHPACSRLETPAHPPTPPQRIAAVGPAAFLLIDALYLFPAATNRLIAFSDDLQLGSSNSFAAFFDPALPSKMRLGPSAGPEQTAAAKPDLVVLKSSAPRLASAYEALRLPVLPLDLESPEAYDRTLATLGTLFHDPDTATRWRAYFTDIRRRVAAQTPSPPPRVLLARIPARTGGAITVPPASWMQTRLVEMAGGIPVWKNAASSGAWQTINPEQLAIWNPDVILLVAYSPFTPADLAALRANPSWRHLQAVRTGRIAVFPADFHSWDLPDVRWGLGLLWTANQLSHAQPPPFDLPAETIRFYQLLGVPPEKTRATVFPLLGF